MSDWKARRILKEICDPGLRRAVLGTFWEDAEPPMRSLVMAHLARSLHFRTETIMKASLEKKCEWLAMPLAVPELIEAQEMALMLYHLNRAHELLGAFLDHWQIPHEKGSIEVDDYTVPDDAAVEAAVNALKKRFELRDILLYLSTAGLLMGQGEPAWRASTWPLVDRLLPGLGAPTVSR